MIVVITKEYPTAEEMVIPWLKYKLGLKCGENIRKLFDAPSFCYTASPQLGSGWGSKPPKHYYGFKYDLRCTTQYSTGTKMFSKNFKLQIWAKIDHFLHFFMFKGNFSFWRFTGKRMGLELRVVISANINLTIAVILSLNLSLYELQKPRYDFPLFAIARVTKSRIFDFLHVEINYGST